MAKQSDQQAPGLLPFQMPDFRQFLNGGMPTFNSFAHSGNALLKSIGELNTQILGFAKQRLDAGVAAGQSLIQCKSPQAAIEMQMEYARSEMQAYLDEARKIAELAGRLASEDFRPAQGEQKKG